MIFNIKFALPVFLIFQFFSTLAYSETDMVELKDKASKGDALSQYLISLEYILGKNVAADKEESTKWLRMSAENGYAAAQLDYGKSLPDKVKGIEWIQRAADSGNVKSELFLGQLYRTEINQYVKLDYSKAIYWLGKAAERNEVLESATAAFQLAMMYESGDGVEENSALASKWMAVTDKVLSSVKTEDLYSYGMEAKDYHINEGVMYLRCAAERGDARAQYELGKMYQYGYESFNSQEIGKLSLAGDAVKSLRWLTLAADQGHVKAMYDIGYNYSTGYFGSNQPDALKKDSAKALQYLTWAAKKGHKESQERLDSRNTYESFEWTKRRDNEAFTLYVDYDFTYNWLAAEVTFSKSNDKRIYFTHTAGEASTCQPEDYKDDGDHTVWQFNGQAISMVVFCNKGKFNYKYATPNTVQGQNFVVDLFRKSSDTILVEGYGHEFPLSSKGFWNVWSKVSSKAL